MLEGKSIAVVVPAYREEELIGATLGGIAAVVWEPIVRRRARHA